MHEIFNAYSLFTFRLDPLTTVYIYRTFFHCCFRSLFFLGRLFLWCIQFVGSVYFHVFLAHFLYLYIVFWCGFICALWHAQFFILFDVNPMCMRMRMYVLIFISTTHSFYTLHVYHVIYRIFIM